MLPKNLSKNPFDHHVIFGFVTLLFVVFSSAFANAETLTWTNNGGSGSWHDDTNWNPTQVPTDEDDVIIPVGTDPVEYSSNTTNLNSLSCSGSLTISNGILNLSSASSIGTGGTFILSGGSLGGSGALTVSGAFTWSGGTLSGAGSVDIGVGVTLTLSGNATKNLFDRTLNNAGSIVVTGTGRLDSRDSTIFNSGSFDIQSDADLDRASGGADPVFENSGSFKKSAGSGVTLIDRWIINHSGTSMQVQTGTLRLRCNSTVTSSLAVASGAVLTFDGSYTHDFQPGSALSGDGTVNFNGGNITIAGMFSGNRALNFNGATVTISGSYTVTGPITVSSGNVTFDVGSITLATLTLSGGTLGGTVDWTITDTFTWSGGTLGGTGSVDIGVGVTLTLSGNSTKNLFDRTLNNAGSIVVTGTGRLNSRDSTIFNSGSFDIQSDADLDRASGGAAPVFENSGSFKKSAGSGVTLIDRWIVNHSGTSMQVQTGTLRLRCNSTVTSSLAVASGAVLTFDGSYTHDFQPGSALSGDGTVNFNGGTITIAGMFSGNRALNFNGAAVTINGSYTVTGPITVSSGNVTFDVGSITLAMLTLSGGTLGGTVDWTITDTFTWSGGTLGGTGSVDIGVGVTLTLSGNSTKNLFDRTLNNAGSIVVTGTGRLDSRDSTIFNSGSFDIQSDADLDRASGGADPVFENSGSFKKSAGSGVTLIDRWIINHSGTSMQVQTGTLRLRCNSTVTSSLDVASGAVLTFDGSYTHDFQPGSALSGDGTVNFNGGNITIAGMFSGNRALNFNGATVTISGSYTVTGPITVSSGNVTFDVGSITLATLTLSGGTLGGTVDWTITDTFTWSGGTLGGTGSVDIGVGVTLTLSGNSTKNLFDRTLNNAGSIIVTGTGRLNSRDSTIFNSGSFDIQSDADLDRASGGAAPVFENSGSFKKSAGSGVTLIDRWLVNHSGTSMQVQAGTLKLRCNSTVTGSLAVASGAVLTFDGSYTHDFQPGSALSGDGTVNFNGGSITIAGMFSGNRALNFDGAAATINGSYTVTGPITVSGGTATFNTGANIADLNLSGGNLGGIGAVTVSGLFTWTGGTLVGSGGMTISGTATVSGSANKILNEYSLINTGTITWTQGIIRFNNSAQIDNQATGSFILDADTNLNLGWSSAISGTFTNAGTLSKNGAGTAYFNIPLTNSGTIGIHAGTVKLSSNITSTGRFKGTGTLDASSINFVNAGQLSPGTSPGIFNFIGNYQQSSNGTLNIEIAGTGSADYDRLAISANADVSGTLDISLLSSFTPADGNSFTIVTFAMLSGLFTQINYPVLSTGLAWQYRALATSIELYCGIDTDRDGLTDTLENTACTDTNDADTDDDALLDGQEDLNKNGQREPWETDPCDEDTDNDTMPDGWEVGHGLDPLDSSDCGQDPDDDLLTNCEEYLHDTDPNNADSDADGMPDGWEVDNDFDPLVDDALEDADQDGYSNLREYLSGSDPWDHQDLPAVIADVDADNDCDGYDLAMFMLEYGRDDCDTVTCDYDLDLDGDIDEIDLFLFAEDYGRIDE